MGDRKKDLSITRSQGLLAVFLAGEPFAEGQPVPQTLPAANPAARNYIFLFPLGRPKDGVNMLLRLQRQLPQVPNHSSTESYFKVPATIASASVSRWIIAGTFFKKTCASSTRIPRLTLMLKLIVTF